MKIKIGVLGSCISRDAFNSKFVHNYKDFVEVKFSAQRTSIISIMQNPISIDEQLINIHPITQTSKSETQCISDDLNRSFLNKLIENEIDFLIIDNYFEVIMGILYFDNIIITNNYWDLPKTEFNKCITNELILKITEYPEEFFLIWSKYCDLFFKFLEIYCPNVKVILNKGRELDKILKSNNDVYINEGFTEQSKVNNPLLDILDSYIINNFDVHVFEFDYESTFLDENHPWGISPVHYHKPFYYSLIETIKDISHNNYKQKSKYNLKINSEQLFKKELEKTNYETRILLKNIKNISNNLQFYKRGRLDVKNFGSKNNKIEVIESNISPTKHRFPNWFKDDEGEGLVIESEIGLFDLKIKCINDGLLKVFLRGPDIRDKNNKRFPVYIDYINFNINGNDVLNDNYLVWHDDPYIFQKEVKNSEIINIHAKWLPFNTSSTYKK